jgi:hypothetical protein
VDLGIDQAGSSASITSKSLNTKTVTSKLEMSVGPEMKKKYSAKGSIRSLNHSPHIAIFTTKFKISNPSSISKLEPLQCPYLSYHYQF